MMHADENTEDTLEILCSEPKIQLKRYRMRRTQRLADMSLPGMEAMLILMQGEVEVEGHPFRAGLKLSEKDICYIPRDEEFEVKRIGNFSELILAYAPGEKKYAHYVKRFADTEPIRGGAPTYRRLIYNMVTEADQANRFLGGFVRGENGNWGGFPPHKHDGKPEVYVYYGMGRGFCLQAVMMAGKELVFVVRDGDSVYFNEGYHPCVASPGSGMNFLWIISADSASRNLAVDIHPDFRDMPVGETHLKIS